MNQANFLLLQEEGNTLGTTCRSYVTLVHFQLDCAQFIKIYDPFDILAACRFLLDPKWRSCFGQQLLLHADYIGCCLFPRKVTTKPLDPIIHSFRSLPLEKLSYNNSLSNQVMQFLFMEVLIPPNIIGSKVPKHESTAGTYLLSSCQRKCHAWSDGSGSN